MERDAIFFCHFGVYVAHSTNADSVQYCHDGLIAISTSLYRNLYQIAEVTVSFSRGTMSTEIRQCIVVKEECKVEGKQASQISVH